MKNSFLLISIILIANLYLLNAFDSSDFCSLKIGDTVKIIDKKNDYELRIYYFIDISSCIVCNLNIGTYYQIFKDRKVEFVAFVNKMNDSETTDLVKQYNWNIKTIGDEFEIYKSYYKIENQGAMLVLNNKGKVLAFHKIGNIPPDTLFQMLDSTAIIFNNNSIKPKQHLKEIKRTIITKDNKPFVTNSIFREVKKNIKNNLYVFKDNFNACPIYFVDSNAKIFKEINNNTYPNFDCMFDYHIKWIEEDTLLLIFHSNHKKKYLIQNYDKIHDTIITKFILNPNLSGKRSWVNTNCEFIKKSSYFINAYFEYGSINNFLNEADSTILVYDSLGNFFKIFNTPDSVYTKFKISKFFSEFFFLDENDDLVSYQRFAKQIKFWDDNYNLKRVANLNFGSNYRDVKMNFKDNSSMLDYANIYNNTSICDYMLYNKSSKWNLIVYRNETYPPGVSDFSSEEVTRKRYFNISDSTGKRLTDDDILMDGSCVPFYFDDSYIYCSEVVNKHLEFVIYKLEL